MKNLINTRQAAVILGCGSSRVRQLILAGRLPSARKHEGRDWLIPEKNVRALALENRKPGRPPATTKEK